jgi:hypothetical protein
MVDAQAETLSLLLLYYSYSKEVGEHNPPPTHTLPPPPHTLGQVAVFDPPGLRRATLAAAAAALNGSSAPNASNSGLTVGRKALAAVRQAGFDLGVAGIGRPNPGWRSSFARQPAAAAQISDFLVQAWQRRDWLDLTGNKREAVQSSTSLQVRTGSFVLTHDTLKSSSYTKTLAQPQAACLGLEYFLSSLYAVPESCALYDYEKLVSRVP